MEHRQPNLRMGSEEDGRVKMMMQVLEGMKKRVRRSTKCFTKEMEQGFGGYNVWTAKHLDSTAVITIESSLIDGFEPAKPLKHLHTMDEAAVEELSAHLTPPMWCSAGLLVLLQHDS